MAGAASTAIPPHGHRMVADRASESRSKTLNREIDEKRDIVEQERRRPYRSFICELESSRLGRNHLAGGFYLCLRASFILSRLSGERDTSGSKALLSNVNRRIASLMKSICLFASGQSLHIMKWTLTPIRCGKGSFRSRDSDTNLVTSLQLNIQ